MEEKQINDQKGATPKDATPRDMTLLERLSLSSVFPRCCERARRWLPVAGAGVNGFGKVGKLMLVRVGRLPAKGCFHEQYCMQKRDSGSCRRIDQGEPTNGSCCTHVDSVKCMKILINAGADVNRANRKGYSALMAAAEMGNTRVVLLLIVAGADVNYANSAGDTAVLCAAFKGRTQCLRVLMAGGANANARDISNKNAIFMAAWGGQCDVLPDLVKAGVDVNIADKDGLTPLMRAVKSGHTEFVKQLISAGADVNAKAKDGATALILAYIEDEKRTIKKALIEAGADVNVTKPGDRTLLLESIGSRDCDMVEAILGAGADVNVVTGSGDTALLSAVDAGMPHLVEKLVKAGADVEQSQKGFTPLLTAIFSPRGFYIETAEILVHAGADVNRQNVRGWTPLLCAISQGVPLQPFLSTGADVNRTPGGLLRPAVNSPHPLDYLECLLKHGLQLHPQSPLALTDPDLAELVCAAGQPVCLCCPPEEMEEAQNHEGGFDDFSYCENNNLQSLCRQFIRAHMMKVSKVNLFYRVPKLGVTHTVESFLLYEHSVCCGCDWCEKAKPH